MKNICRELWNAAKKLKVVLTIFSLLIVVPLSIWAINNKATDKPTFFLTLIAFLAAAYAIWQQYKALEHQIAESKNQDEVNKTALAIQREALTQQINANREQREHDQKALLEQQTLGAWQVLANKAPGNSGKKEAIEFLAKQGKSLRGIDMSIYTNGGQVFLQGLDLKGLNADLIGAKFQGANLCRANLKGSHLCGTYFMDSSLVATRFDTATLLGADFSNAELTQSDLSKSQLFDTATFRNNYVLNIFKQNDNDFLSRFLPKAPDGYKFDFIYNDDGTIKTERLLDKKGGRTVHIKYLIELIKTK